MGQAKRRGSFEERVKQAVKRAQDMGLNPPIPTEDDVLNFRPDWGTKAKQINKKRYAMNMLVMCEAVANHSINQIPHRFNEITTDVPFEGKNYCGTWQITPEHRHQIATCMMNGHMGFTIDYRIGKEEECAFETIRPLIVTRITPSAEVYQAGGKFNFVLGTHGTTTMAQIGQAFSMPQKEPA